MKGLTRGGSINDGGGGSIQTGHLRVNPTRPLQRRSTKPIFLSSRQLYYFESVHSACTLLEMRFFSLLALACTASVAFAAKSSPDTFEHYRSLAGTRSLNLNDDLYEELTGTPRDFHMAVLLTTLEARYGCELCEVFQPEWELVARSWAKGAQSTDIKLLLGTLEFKNGRKIFQRVRYHHCSLPMGYARLTMTSATTQNSTRCSPVPSHCWAACEEQWRTVSVRVYQVGILSAPRSSAVSG